MGHDHKTDAIFFVLFYEVFLKQKYKSLKRKCFYVKNICKMKVFLKQK